MSLRAVCLYFLHLWMWEGTHIQSHVYVVNDHPNTMLSSGGIQKFYSANKGIVKCLEQLVVDTLAK